MGTDVSRSHPHSVVILLVAFVSLSSGSARAAWDGTQQIVLGDRLRARFATAPGIETHDFTFYAPDGTATPIAPSNAHAAVADPIPVHASVPMTKCSTCHPAIAPPLTFPPGAAQTFPGLCE